MFKDIKEELEELDTNPHFIEYKDRMEEAAKDSENPDAHKAANMKFSYFSDLYPVILARHRHRMPMGFFHNPDIDRQILLHIIDILNFINSNSEVQGEVPVFSSGEPQPPTETHVDLPTIE